MEKDADTLRIALLQLLPGRSAEENLSIGLEACRRAQQAGAELALFPEMWSTGYRIPAAAAELQAAALPADGPFVRAFGEAARTLGMAVGITFLEAWPGAPRNTLCLFDRHGRLVLHYAKVHTCDFGAERVLTRGERFETAVLDTAMGPVRVGAMLCYDREFPESARLLMLQGAEVLLVPNACPMECNRLAQLRTRAFENMTAVVTVNYPCGQGDSNGHSTVFDGIAWQPDGTPRDMLLCETGGAPELRCADLPLAALRAYRAREVWGDAYRRPELYGPLTALQKQPPFVRADARGPAAGAEQDVPVQTAQDAPAQTAQDAPAQAAQDAPDANRHTAGRPR